ncbi:MAG TPA: ABC transporter ATP-binding protein, partial [Trichococcus flocculiformis]|nr:ABC transporter ATP-binding protein [Trichococcus flocculiformis]
SGLLSPAVALVTNASYIIIAVLGILQAMAGVMTIGNVQAMVQYVWQVNQPISTITQLSAIIQSATSSIQRVFDLLDQEEEVQGAVK